MDARFFDETDFLPEGPEIAIPTEYHPYIVVYLRENHFPQYSVLDVRKRATPLLLSMRLSEDAVWTMVICAMEWLGTVPADRHARLFAEYETIRLVK